MTIEELFGTLQMSVVASWRKHLRTAKYAKHEALDEFYKEMPEKVDALIEAWMGAHGKKVGSFQNTLSSSNMNTLKYLGELKRTCKEGYALMGDNDELKSLLDDIVNLINSTLYKVKELAESNSFKNLVEYINESLVYEAAKQIEFIFASNLADGFKFALTFNPNSDEDSYQEWDNNGIEPEWAWKNKSLIKKFCKVCKDVEKYCDYHNTTDLGNFPWDDSYAQMELLQDEFDAKDGEKFAFITGDGDNGYFFVIKASDSKGIKAMNELTSLCTCDGGWDWEIITFDSSKLEY